MSPFSWGGKLRPVVLEQVGPRVRALWLFNMGLGERSVKVVMTEHHKWEWAWKLVIHNASFLTAKKQICNYWASPFRIRKWYFKWRNIISKFSKIQKENSTDQNTCIQKAPYVPNFYKSNTDSIYSRTSLG
jgi:hypothetical protein